MITMDGNASTDGAERIGVAMSQTETPTNAKWTPPYTAFRTILDLIERMVKEEPPSRIDKSYLNNYSGGYQTQVIAMLNTLGLRNEETQEVGERMLALVKASETERPRIIAEMVRDFCGPVLRAGR